MAYSYKTVSIEVAYDRDNGLRVDPRSAQFAAELDQTINAYARQGWRVVSITPLLGGVWGSGGSPSFSRTYSVVVTFELG